MKTKLFLLLLNFFSLYCIAQPMGGGSINWLPDGNSYTTLDKYTIVKTELPSMTKSVLYDLGKLIPNDETKK